MMWQARRDSNPQHSDLESDALPLELLACFHPITKSIHPAAQWILRFGLFGFFVRYMFFAESAVFAELQLVRRRPLVFGCGVVSSFAFRTCKYYELPHFLPLYSIISVTTPAPTVLPPSLMAKRSSFSRAMGVTSSTLRVTLSPGMTISTPSGSLAIPVTSVVLR